MQRCFGYGLSAHSGFGSASALLNVAVGGGKFEPPHPSHPHLKRNRHD